MLEPITRRFTDRHDAGRELAERLRPLAAESPVVLGRARGGVPVAYEAAQALGAPLDVLVVRKIGEPGNPELGIGAIAEGHVRVPPRRRAADRTERRMARHPPLPLRRIDGPRPQRPGATRR
jgi:predicted phosphoribosyltransferase